MSVIGEAKLQLFYNDGHKGTGTADEMALEERSKLAVDGIVVASIDVIRVTGSMEQVTRQLTEEEVCFWGCFWLLFFGFSVDALLDSHACHTNLTNLTNHTSHSNDGHD